MTTNNAANVGLSGSTGTGSFVGSTSPVLTTPNIGSATGSISGNAGTVTNGVYTTDTGTVTNTMLAGSIANAKLSNSSITVNGTSIALGASGTATAAAGTLTGATLASGVTASSLTSFGASIALGTPASGVLTNCTSLPMASINSGTVNSFTPHLQDSSGHDYSMTQQFGAYIQVGQMYFVWIFISWNGKGSAVSTDQVKITNFPLTATVSRGAGCIGGNNGLGTGTQCNISTDIDIGANYAWIWRNVTGTSSQMLVSQTATSGELQAFYCYY